jgi:hypothetical protein
MRVHPARAAPPLDPDALIAPHQLWRHLSRSQQQHVRKVLVGVAQQLLAHLPSPLPPEGSCPSSVRIINRDRSQAIWPCDRVAAI